MNESALPETVEQAVRLLKSLIEKGEQDKNAAMPESDLVMLHRGLGRSRGTGRSQRGGSTAAAHAFHCGCKVLRFRCCTRFVAPICFDR